MRLAVFNQNGLKACFRHRAAQVIALAFIATVVFQEHGLFGGFHAFCHDAHLQAMRHRDQGAGQAAVGLRLRDGVDEAAVQLEAVYR